MFKYQESFMKIRSTIVKSILSATILSISSLSFASVECQLGNVCSIPNTLDSIYYAFNPDQGSKFTCELRATKGDALEVSLSSGDDFVFPTITLKADKSGEVLSTTIPGHYKEN